jgi:hypothetical protein
VLLSRDNYKSVRARDRDASYSKAEGRQLGAGAISDFKISDLRGLQNSGVMLKGL